MRPFHKIIMMNQDSTLLESTQESYVESEAIQMYPITGQFSLSSNGSSFSNISGREILRDIWLSVYFIGEASLGFTSADVGTHSVRAFIEMIMFLAK